MNVPALPRNSDLRQERDRYVAFAFAAGEAFLELDARLHIDFVVGAPQSLLGKAGPALTGTSFLDRVAPADRALARNLVEAARRQGRAGPVPIGLLGRDGSATPVCVGATCLPADPERVYLALRRQPGGAAAFGKDLARDQATGLLAADSFAAVGGELLAEAPAAGDAYGLTLVGLEGLEAAGARLPADARAALLDDIAAQLRANSLDGAAAARLQPDRYGLYHRADLDIAGLKAAVEERLRAAQLPKDQVHVDATSINLAAEGLEADDQAKVLVYVVNKFAEGRGSFTFADLGGAWQDMVEDTRQRIDHLRDALYGKTFDVVFQPVVTLSGRRLHHYEALIRLTDYGAGAGELIRFAEESGLITELDFAMCRRVVERIVAARRGGQQVKIAVNLSGRSLENELFIGELAKLLSDAAPIHQELLFEVTESWGIRNLAGANQVLTMLRKRGHEICLDDFGAGASGFQYLKLLDVNFVKIDGSFVRDAHRTAQGRSFLAAVTSLCRELGIRTIAEMVEDEDAAAFLLENGVDFGQGYLFGRPSSGLRAVG